MMFSYSLSLISQTLELHIYYIYDHKSGWWRGTAVEHRSLAGELDLSGVRNRSEEVLKSERFYYVRHIDSDIKGVSTYVRNVLLS